MNEPYFRRLQNTVSQVVANLSAKGVHDDRLCFGGPGKIPARRRSIPTDARSEFLANRAMGDWAEAALADALNRTFPEWKVVQYGVSDRIAAGHPEFKKRYQGGLEETRLMGKRPDILLFPNDFQVEADLSERTQADTESVAKKAIAAIEVRSSKFEALTYMSVRRRQREAGNRGGRETPSFTVKVEDLVIVYRWLERNRVPQAYCQVFFDSVFAINFLEIFTTIASGTGFQIESPKKSQEKATIMIPITAGLQVGHATSLPSFAAEQRVTLLGRHDAYVVPKGGGFVLDAENMHRVLGTISST